MLAQLLHVQVAPARQPLLRLLNRQCRHQSRRHAALLGKILTTLVRRFISWLKRSRPLVVRMRLRWLSGNARQERHSSVLSSRWQATFSLPPSRATLLGHRAGEPKGLLFARRGEDRSQVRCQLLTLGGAHRAEKVPDVMHLAPLPRRSLEVPPDGGFQALVSVGNHQLDALP